MRFWTLMLVLVACGGNDKETDADTDATDTDTDADADTDADTDTDTDTDTTTPGHDGTYVGVLNITLDNASPDGRDWNVVCAEAVEFNFVETNEPMITGVGACDASAEGAGMVNINFTGNINVDPAANGNVALNGLAQNDNWTGEFTGDTFTGSFDGDGPYQGGTLTWTASWTADR